MFLYNLFLHFVVFHVSIDMFMSVILTAFLLLVFTSFVDVNASHNCVAMCAFVTELVLFFPGFFDFFWRF